jgi:hypothetical protein
MAAVSGQGTIFTLPNYHGELFTVTPTETPFLSAIGGLVGAKKTTATQFEWQTIDRRVSTAGNVGLEGANAPNGTERSRSNVTNVVEIHHSAIEVSYSRLAAKGNFAGANIAAQPDDLLLDELQVQTQAELESMAVDVEQSFISGTYAKPADNLTGRKTRGILAAITTNVTAVAGPLTKAAVDALLIKCFTAGAKLPTASTVFMVGPDQKVKLSNLYSTSVLNQPTMTRNVGGINIDTLVTDFGTFGVMVNRWMPATGLAIVDLSVCAPVFLEIPGKGLLFVEELARVGSARKFQMYGEIGLEYGPETFHGQLTGLT